MNVKRSSSPIVGDRVVERVRVLGLRVLAALVSSAGRSSKREHVAMPAASRPPARPSRAASSSSQSTPTDLEWLEDVRDVAAASCSRRSARRPRRRARARSRTAPTRASCARAMPNASPLPHAEREQPVRELLATRSAASPQATVPPAVLVLDEVGRTPAAFAATRVAPERRRSCGSHGHGHCSRRGHGRRSRSPAFHCLDSRVMRTTWNGSLSFGLGQHPRRARACDEARGAPVGRLVPARCTASA